jgi:hypothetical protein
MLRIDAPTLIPAASRLRAREAAQAQGRRQCGNHHLLRRGGAGALFRVSTLDLTNLPKTPQGEVDFAQDFFGREAFLTVSEQLNVEAYCLALTKVYTFGPTFPQRT